ncbi:Protein BUD31-like 1 [Porphyridium purpureum]|uniref:Protein BUD31-like 1 n=1 Tax=Porphyridium purpureum TaxID=35688 RepID=A0A5J4Z1H4_PORPP|nr:Protein BUD31-like 1 [Porphyridium purpureum]|eukprot:POR2391..scf208_2
MSWRVKLAQKTAPADVQALQDLFERHDAAVRVLMEEDISKKMRAELQWGVHRANYEKNRSIYERGVSERGMRYLVKHNLVDAKLIAKWKKPGYERLCSTAAVTTSNTNMGTVSICRVPLRCRQPEQVRPSVLTGCVTCATEDDGPIWWNEEPPERVLTWVFC